MVQGKKGSGKKKNFGGEKDRNEESFIEKKKADKNEYKNPICMNTYGGCMNKPREKSNFCSIECEKYYMGEREFKRPEQFYIKFFEREKAITNTVNNPQ